MKKIFSIFFVLLICLTCFSACADSEDESNANVIIANYSIKNFENEDGKDSDDFIVEVQDLGGVYSELYDKTGLYVVVKDDRIVDADGNVVSRDDLKIGTTLQIKYSGDLVKKNPKTIKAYEITVVG